MPSRQADITTPTYGHELRGVCASHADMPLLLMSFLHVVAMSRPNLDERWVKFDDDNVVLLQTDSCSAIRCSTRRRFVQVTPCSDFAAVEDNFGG